MPKLVPVCPVNRWAEATLLLPSSLIGRLPDAAERNHQIVAENFSMIL
jgi:hypothetical protein